MEAQRSLRADQDKQKGIPAKAGRIFKIKAKGWDTSHLRRDVARTL